MSLQKSRVLGSLIATTLLLAVLTTDVYATDDALTERPRGVSKSKAELYVAKDGMFTCLDGSLSIPFKRVNDDYCDCPDGSDEPGTSACPNGVFHCINRWHRPANIPSSRVNDGICDPACCDGSDEYDGKVTCPDRCKEVGAADREKRKQNRLIRLEGGRKRLEYMASGKTAKVEREQKLAVLRQEEQELTKKLEELRVAKEKVEEIELRESETPQARRLQALKDRNADLEHKIETARGRLSTLRADIDNLMSILKDMKENHNQNYHDMAVTHAITAYDAFETQRNARYEPTNDDDLSVVNDSSWIDEGYTGDHSYSSPDITVQMWNTVKGWIGLYTPSVDEILRNVQNGQFPDGDALRTAYNEAESRKHDVERDIRAIEGQEHMDYGADQRFAALEGQCFNLDVEEYTYKVCLFDSVKQQKKGESWDTDLGRFSGWDTSELGDNADDEAKHQVLLFKHGQQCWDGPQRSVTIRLQCGVREEILSVKEPEKCVYTMTMTTPAVCPIPDDKSTSQTMDQDTTKDTLLDTEESVASDTIKDEL